MSNLTKHLISKAQKHGATFVDVLYMEGTGTSIRALKGHLESFETAQSRAIGLRVMVGQKQAVAVSSNMTDGALDKLAERVVAMAKNAPDDPHAAYARPQDWAQDIETHLKNMDLADPNGLPDVQVLKDWALELEATAATQQGISNVSDANAQMGDGIVYIENSEGFSGSYNRTSFAYDVTALAGEGTNMVRDHAHTAARHLEDLRTLKEIALEAAERTINRQNASSMHSGRMPVVYDRRVAGGLLGHLAGAVNGDSVAMGTSFLGDMMGQSLFPDHITIKDAPHMKRGFGSKPFDAEGLATQPLNVIENGVLKHWLLDLASANKLNLQSNGHASRGAGSLPHPATTNLYMEPGKQDVKSLIGDIENGLLVTALIGHGVNLVTGDYSRGAEGFLIENGKIGRPVQEVTVAGNLKEMFKTLTPADDLMFESSINSPSARIEGMTVAGS